MQNRITTFITLVAFMQAILAPSLLATHSYDPGALRRRQTVTPTRNIPAADRALLAVKNPKACGGFRSDPEVNRIAMQLEPPVLLKRKKPAPGNKTQEAASKTATNIKSVLTPKKKGDGATAPQPARKKSMVQKSYEGSCSQSISDSEETDDDFTASFPKSSCATSAVTTAHDDPVIFQYADVADQGCLTISRLHDRLISKGLGYSITLLFVANGVVTFVSPTLSKLYPEHDQWIQSGFGFATTGIQAVSGLLKRHRDWRQAKRTKVMKQEKIDAFKARSFAENYATGGKGSTVDDYLDARDSGGSSGQTIQARFKPKPIAETGSDFIFFIVGLVNFSIGLVPLIGSKDLTDIAIPILIVFSVLLQGAGVFLKKVQTTQEAEKTKRRQQKINQANAVTQKIFGAGPIGADAV